MTEQEVFDILSQVSTFKNIKKCLPLKSRKSEYMHWFSFDSVVMGEETSFLIGVEENFPLVIPGFFLLDSNLDYIPHLDPDGKICYTHEDYLWLNYDMPQGIIEESFLLALETVEKGLKKENLDDFVNEFEAYWGKFENTQSLFCNISLESFPSLIKIGFHDKVRIAVSDSDEHLKITKRFINITEKGITFQNGIYIPLNPNQLLIPPRNSKEITLEYVKNLIIGNTGPEEYKRFLDLLPTTSKSEEFIIFSFTNSAGTDVIFGIKFSNIQGKPYPIESGDSSVKVTPIAVQRLDKDYLYKRGGNGEDELGKKGLLIGCGSIGGLISEELIRNGLFDLTLVDGDKMSIENCYRHLCGFAYIGKNKALALKEKIEVYFPHSKIKAFNTSIQNVLNKKLIDFKDYDYVIVATGNVTVNSFLNRHFSKIMKGKPVFYIWNEPYGIGGHCLVTNISKEGCYSCLYENDDKANPASFANKIQKKPFLKSISGCGSTYTPYGSLDSYQTTLLTVRKVIDVLQGKIIKNSIFSWKGNPDSFVRQGFDLSARYNLDEQELENRKHSFYNSNCTVCKHQVT